MSLAVKYLNFEIAEKLRINNFQFRIKSWSLQVLDLAAFVKLLPLQSSVKFAKSFFIATKNVKPNIQKITRQLVFQPLLQKMPSTLNMSSSSKNFFPRRIDTETTLITRLIRIATVLQTGFSSLSISSIRRPKPNLEI